MCTRRSPVALLIAGLTLVGAAGCGAGTTIGAGGTLRVALTEYRVIPEDVHVSAGAVTISVRNNGRLTHDLVITRDGVTVASTKPIPPGQAVVMAAALAPGQYVMASSVLSDQALGAYGTLDVGG